MGRGKSSATPWLLSTCAKPSGDPPLLNIFQALDTRDKLAVARALAKGASVHARGNGRKTALMAAAADHAPDIIQLLYDAGANVHAVDAFGSTAVHRAAEHGHYVALDLLLRLGARADVADVEGITPLMRAAAGGRGAAAGHSSEQEHAYCPPPRLKDCVDRLLGCGALASARACDGRSTVHFAAEGGDAGVIAVLADKGADAAAVTDKGTTALMVAAAEGHADAVRKLMELGVQVDTADPSGRTALIEAAEKGHETVAQLLLLQGGANVHAATHDGLDSLLLAVQGRHWPVVKLLIQHGACSRQSMLSLAKRDHGGAEDIEMLLKAGADANAKDETGASALLWSIKGTNREEVGLYRYLGSNVTAFELRPDRKGMVRALLAAGADANAADAQGETPLMWAHRLGQAGAAADVALMLVKAGADVHAKSKNGVTALQRAALFGPPDLVAVLVGRGANAGDAMFQIIAADGACEGALEKLLDEGADPCARDSNNRSVLQVAREKGLVDIVGMLERRGAREEGPVRMQ